MTFALPGVAGTFAVSFFVSGFKAIGSAAMEAEGLTTAGAVVGAVGAVAPAGTTGGGTEEGFTGIAGATAPCVGLGIPGAESGFGMAGIAGALLAGFGIPGTEGGFGIDGIAGTDPVAGIEGAAGGFDGAAAPTLPGAPGGLGIPGTDGGFGIEGIPPGVERGVPTGGLGITGAPGAGMGLGGKLIIADSRGLDPTGCP